VALLRHECNLYENAFVHMTHAFVYVTHAFGFASCKCKGMCNVRSCNTEWRRSCNTGWRRPIGCRNLQIIFRKRATNYRALLRKMTYKDKASYGSRTHLILRLHTVRIECIICMSCVYSCVYSLWGGYD